MEDQQQLEKEIKDLEGSYEDGKDQLSHEDHITLTKRCKDQMEKINTLAEKTNKSVEEEELASLRDKFLSADFQMSKLLPNWGLSPQSGSTYYLQKVESHLWDRQSL